MNRGQILELLKDLAERDCTLEAPAGIEDRLLYEFRRLHRMRAVRNAVLWCCAAAAAFTAGFLPVRLYYRVAPAPPPQQGLAPHGPAEAIPRTEQIPPAARIQSKDFAPPRMQTRAKPSPALPDHEARRMRPEALQELATDFFPLAVSAAPVAAAELLRVQLPAAAMQTVGLPVPEERLADPVDAEVLVGEDGLPRAIRFIGFEVK
jgi:hypothetical protein